MKKNCPDCNIEMIEVKKALIEGKVVPLYPKDVLEKIRGKTYYEYRFFCKKCKKEWTYNSAPHCRYFEELPSDAQFRYSQKKGLLI